MISVLIRLAAGAGYLLGATILVLIPFLSTAAPSAAQSACETTSFAAGTQWTLCWELRQREGLVINVADYRDKGGVSRRVLYRGSIAEVHVPYHPGFPRFLDVTFDTAGLGANAPEPGRERMRWCAGGPEGMQGDPRPRLRVEVRQPLPEGPGGHVLDQLTARPIQLHHQMDLPR